MELFECANFPAESLFSFEANSKLNLPGKFGGEKNSVGNVKNVSLPLRSVERKTYTKKKCKREQKEETRG